MSKPWEKREWKEKRASVLKDSCEWCGSKKSLVLHHANETRLRDDDYSSLEKEVVTLCRRCHLAHHRHMHLCPECKTKYKSDAYEFCYACGIRKGTVTEDTTAEDMRQFLGEADSYYAISPHLSREEAHELFAELEKIQNLPRAPFT